MKLIDVDFDKLELSLKRLKKLLPCPQGTIGGDAYRAELRSACVFVREVYRHGYFIVRYSGMIDKSLCAYQLIPMGEDANKRVIEVEKIANEDEALRQYECIVLELMRGLV